MDEEKRKAARARLAEMEEENRIYLDGLTIKRRPANAPSISNKKPPAEAGGSREETPKTEEGDCPGERRNARTRRPKESRGETE